MKIQVERLIFQMKNLFFLLKEFNNQQLQNFSNQIKSAQAPFLNNMNQQIAPSTQIPSNINNM